MVRSAAQQRLAAANRQLGVPEFGSILASGLLWHGVDGQRCPLQLKPDPLGGKANTVLKTRRKAKVENRAFHPI